MNNRELVVKGIGRVKNPPDLIIITMKVEARDMSYEKSMFKGKEKLDTLREAITSAGHDSDALKTTNFNVRTEHESYKVGNEYKSRFAGYACHHDLKLEFDLDLKLLGVTLSAIGNSRVNPTFNIAFSIKDTQAVSEQLLESAIENAKRKATVLAKAAGVKLGEIQRIDYSWSDIHFYSDTQMQMSYTDCAAGDDYIDIEPDDIDVRDTATVVWSIE